MTTDEKLSEIILAQLVANGKTQQAVAVRISGSESTFKRRIKRPTKMPLDEVGRMFRVLNFNRDLRAQYIERMYQAEIGGR